jgi:hypothetical protein
MSRHFYDCEVRCTVRVHLGYLSINEEYFLEVERIGPGADPELLYASDNEVSKRQNTLDAFRKELKRLGLVVPESMFRAVEEDAARSASNRYVQHFADGRMIELTQD